MAPRMRRRITSAKREQIEKEQEELSRSIVRPFDVLAGLPVSYSEPPYGHYEDVLKNPLTVKDSAILYRSLMKSRTNYMLSAPMFRLYWYKQTAYARKLMGENRFLKHDFERVPVLSADVSARDVMVKLCDSGITLGPHFFEVRIFIAKDDRSKKKEEETAVKDEKDADKDGNDSIIETEKNSTSQETVPPSNTTEPTDTNPETAKPDTPSKPTEVVPKEVTPKEAEPKKTKRDPADAVTEENDLMVNNLKAVAKVDPNIRNLMRVVAAGEANHHQLMIFQGYILRAREMGAPPHPFLVPNFRLDPHLPLRIRKPSKEKGRKYLKYPRKGVKDQKLTAFQEKYMSDATLVFEFVENSNVRYMLPKHAICEVLQSKKGSDDRDILISFFWIHNQNELDTYEAALEEYNDSIKERERKEKEEEEERKKEEERQRLIAEGKIEEEPPEPEPLGKRRRRPPPRRGAQKKFNKPPKKLVEPVEPELRYTAVSFVLHDISTRFVPLILNSMKPEDEVREYMKHVMQKGTRSSSLHLWYQVDGKVDEKLADNVRAELVNEEKKMNGFSSLNVNAAKKRKL